MITKNAVLHTRISADLLQESQEIAKALNMHHSTFVRKALEEKIRGTKRMLKVMEIVKSSEKG